MGLDKTVQSNAILPWDSTTPDLKKQVGSYKVLNKIGEGAFGEVYEVQDLRRKGHYSEALKLLSKREELTRFREEIDLLNKLNLEGVVKVKDFGVHEDHSFYIMDYLDEPLNVLEYCVVKSLTIYEVTKLFKRYFRILESVHSQGIIHRDIKPENLLIDKEGRPHIIDFGIAKQLDGSADLNQTGMHFIGTPIYSSPEQFISASEAQASFDIYSLNIVFYMALCRGQHPKDFRFYNKDGCYFIDQLKVSKDEIKIQLLKSEFVDIRIRNPKLADVYQAYFKKSFSHSIEKRYAKYEHILEAFDSELSPSEEKKLVLLNLAQVKFDVTELEKVECVALENLNKSIYSLVDFNIVISDEPLDCPIQHIISLNEGYLAHYNLNVNDVQFIIQLKELLTFLQLNPIVHRGDFNGNPYKSLLSYEPKDRDVFFGRTKEIQVLTKLIRDNPLVAVLGESGVGKTSLIQAGVAPKFPKPLLIQANKFSSVKDMWDFVKDEKSLSFDFSAACFVKQAVLCDKLNDITLFIDQFESVLDSFVLNDLKCFLDIFLMKKCRVIIALKNETYGHYKNFITDYNYKFIDFYLGNPNENELNEIITAPSLFAGKSFEYDPVSCKTLNQELLSLCIEQEIGLPIISFALSQIFERSADVMSLNAYRDLGELAGIVNSEWESIYAKIDLPGSEKLKLIHQTFSLLISQKDDRLVRKSLLLNRAKDSAYLLQFIHELLHVHILKKYILNDEIYVILSHDSLIQADKSCWQKITDWEKTNKDLIVAYDEVRYAYGKYLQDKSLLNVKDLSKAEFLQDNSWPLEVEVIDLIKVSRRHCRMKKVLSICFIFLMLSLVTFATVNHFQKLEIAGDLHQQKKDLLNLESQSEVLKFKIMKQINDLDLAQSQRQIATVQALLSRDGAYNSIIQELEVISYEYRDWLWGNVLAQVVDFKHITLDDHKSSVISCAYSVNGKFFVSIDRSGIINIYETSFWTLKSSLNSSLKGNFKLISCNDFFILQTDSELYRLDDLKTLKVIHKELDGISKCVLSKDNTQLVLSTENGKLRLFNLNADKQFNTAIEGEHGARVTALAFTKNGYLISGGEDKVVKNWLVLDDELREVYSSANLSKPTHTKKINDGVYIPHKNAFVTVGADKKYCTWKLDNPNKLKWKLSDSTHTDEINKLARVEFEGKDLIVSSSSDSELILRQVIGTGKDLVEDEDLISYSNINQRAISDIVRSPDNQYLAVASLDNSISIIKLIRLLNTAPGDSYYTYEHDQEVLSLHSYEDKMYILDSNKLSYWEPFYKTIQAELNLDLKGMSPIMIKQEEGELHILTKRGVYYCISLKDFVIKTKERLCSSLIQCADFSLGNLVYKDIEGTFSCWSQGESEPLRALKGITYFAFNQNGDLIVYDNKDLYLCDLKTKRKSKLSSIDGDVTSFDFLEEGAFFVHEKGVSGLRNELDFELSENALGDFEKLQFLPNHYVLCKTALDKDLSVWDLRSESRVAQLAIQDDVEVLGSEIYELKNQNLLFVFGSSLSNKDSAKNIIRVIPDFAKLPEKETNKKIKEFALEKGF